MIKLVSTNRYVSIPEISGEILPDFVVLTGVNGAGKSQLLKGINDGIIQVEGIERKKISYLQSSDFIMGEVGAQSFAAYAGYLDQFWNFYQSSINPTLNILRDEGSEPSAESKERLRLKADELNKPIHSLDQNDFIENDPDFTQFIRYRQNIAQILYKPDFIDNPQSRLFQQLFEDADYLLYDFNRQKLAKILTGDYNVGGVLPVQLTTTIINYATLLKENDYARYENEQKGKDRSVLSGEEFEQKYGPKPWELIDQTFVNFSSASLRLDFDSDRYDPHSDEFKLVFEKTLENGDIVKDIPVSALSSGEKTLLALICSIYKSKTSKDFPDLLLLDEIDATLHPSMVASFIKLVFDELVEKRGTKVMIVTHSPTTVALSPEESIFVVNADRNNTLIEKYTKLTAMEILSEGFISVTQDTTRTELQFQVSSTDQDLIYVEGPTDKAYLEEASKRMNEDIFSRISLRFAQGSSGLSGIWNVVKQMPEGNSLTQGKKLILLYDGDQKRPQDKYADNKILVMPFLEDNPLKTGIENLFPKSLVEKIANHDSAWTHTLDNGEVKLDAAYKVEIAEWVIKNAADNELSELFKVIELLKAETTR
jgi:ABC-type uncharacterized transport system ATPase component